MKSKILVTGGYGLVGQSLQEKVDCIFFSRKDCDLRDLVQVQQIFEQYKPDVVIHLANKVAGLYGNMKNNYNFLVENITMNLNILECCRIYKVKRLINILSTCVFPAEGITYPLSSNQILLGEPHSSNAGYSYSKRMLYTGSKFLSEISDIKIINLIPTNLYGEHDNYNLYDSHVIPGLIHKCYLANKNNESFQIKGSGMAKRQFLYAGDLARVILKFIDFPMESNYIETIVSPSQNDEITIKQLAEKISKIFEFSGKINYDNSFSDGQHNKTTDSNELISFFTDFNFINVDEGLEKTIKFFINNYLNIRQ